MDILALVYLLWMCVLIPASMIRNVRRSRQQMTEMPKAAVYRSIILFQLIYFTITAFVAWRLWIDPIPPFKMSILAVVLAIAWLVAKILLSAMIRKHAPLNDGSVIRSLAPRLVPRDIAGMATVAFVAGFAEECTFRHVIPTLLEYQGLGMVGAAILANVVFGAWHILQGPKAVVYIALLGFVNAMLLWATGTLWCPILSHMLYDFVNMILITRRNVPTAD